MKNNEFEELLREIGKGADVDQLELAARMGISPPTCRRYIREPGTMQMDTMRKLNRVLDIEAEAARELLAYK